jgi:hypothetical protein
MTKNSDWIINNFAMWQAFCAVVTLLMMDKMLMQQPGAILPSYHGDNRHCDYAMPYHLLDNPNLHLIVAGNN